MHHHLIVEARQRLRQRDGRDAQRHAFDGPGHGAGHGDILGDVLPTIDAGEHKIGAALPP